MPPRTVPFVGLNTRARTDINGDVGMTVTEQQMVEATEAGWYPDPDRRHRLRYHDGLLWTDHVLHNGPTPCEGCFGNLDRA